MKLTTSFRMVCLAILCAWAFEGRSAGAYPEVKKGGTLTDTISMSPLTLVPMLTTDAVSSEMSGLFYLPLIGKDSDTWKDVPMVAESVKVSKDKKEYTYTLRKDAKWSDGTPVTATDMEFTYQKLMDPKTQAAVYRAHFQGVSFKKVNEGSFSLRIEEPKYNTLLQFNDFRIIQKKQFEKESDINTTKEAMRPVGNGPFLFKSFSRDQSFVVTRDPNWWGRDLPAFQGSFNFDQITFRIIADATLRYEKFVRGELDLISLTSDQFVNQVSGVDQAKFGKTRDEGKSLWASKFKSDRPQSWFGLAFNFRDPRLASLPFRRAIASLVDVDALVEKAFLGTASRAVSPFGTYTDNVSPRLRDKGNWTRFDMKAATAGLEKEGYSRDPASPFFVREVGGKKLPLKLVLRLMSGSPAQMRAGQILKETFKKAGVDLELRAMDSSAFFKDIHEGEFELALLGWSGGDIQPDPEQHFSTSAAKGGSNYGAYSNPKVDLLIQTANKEFDLKKRQKLIQQIGDILYDELPYVFILERNMVLGALNSRIKSPKWIERFGTALARDLFYE
jgi:ABC-type transport system substrate-binding protein